MPPKQTHAADWPHSIRQRPRQNESGASQVLLVVVTVMALGVERERSRVDVDIQGEPKVLQVEGTGRMLPLEEARRTQDQYELSVRERHIHLFCKAGEQT